MSLFISPSKLRESGILGINGRNVEYINRYNKRSLYPLVDDKLKTKKLVTKYGIKSPKLLLVVEFVHDIKRHKDAIMALSGFAIKPAKGSGGKGILVITGRDGELFVKSSGEKLSYDDIARHLLNTLAGLFSLGGDQDVAIIESLINIDPLFEPYSYQGVPDIRIIIFKGYPVMAMLRLSTKASDGKANLHQGAVGVGIDIQSGRAINAVMNGSVIATHPDTQADLSSIALPNWEELLLLASRCYEITKLGYLGVDIVLDRDEGAMLLELNARPGLSIQVANSRGLLPILKSIEAIDEPHYKAKKRVEFILSSLVD